MVNYHQNPIRRTLRLIEEIKDFFFLFKWNDLIDRVQANDDELGSGLWALLALFH